LALHQLTNQERGIPDQSAISTTHASS